MSQYTLPFKPSDIVLELGGGPEHPRFRPNLDVRPGPAVDIVADLNEPLPIQSQSYDGIFSEFLRALAPVKG